MTRSRWLQQVQYIKEMQKLNVKKYTEIEKYYAYVMDNSVYLPTGEVIVTESPIAKKLYNES